MVKNLVVLISGNGTNLQAIIDAIENKILKNIKIVKVISSKKNAFGIKRALNYGIDSEIIVDNNLLLERLKKIKPNLIVLAGYMKILPENIVNEFKNQIINIHPSLLPKYGGKGMYGIKVHKKVIDNNEKESGATVHFVNSEIDKGRIIIQKSLIINSNDTEITLQKKILENIEHKIYPLAIKKILKE